MLHDIFVYFALFGERFRNPPKPNFKMHYPMTSVEYFIMTASDIQKEN